MQRKVVLSVRNMGKAAYTCYLKATAAKPYLRSRITRDTSGMYYIDGDAIGATMEDVKFVFCNWKN